jgi:nitrite reductase (cytochrome c-552)
MEDILAGIRHAQWRWDYSEASHGASFHAPIETGRIVSTGISIIADTRVKLARLLASKGFNQAVPYPDISTKAKAQAFIGLDMEKLRKEKEVFKENVLPKWIEEAKEREANWGDKVQL